MQSTAQPKTSATTKKISSEALRLNTLGVAYMNQGKSAEAQKSFEQALTADPNFAQAKMNLGISLLAQQKLEQARAALEEASSKLPDDPYAWYNLGLVYKDSAQPEKAIAAFQHVEKMAADEPDAFYFEGFLFSQLQKYDEAIAAFKKALEIAPYHASAQFGLARAYQRKGDTEAAREGMKHFQKLTSEHLGTPFGAGYGDQGKFSLAEFVHGTSGGAPAEISVRYAVKTASELKGASNGVCLLDYDGDGKPDLFFVAAAQGKSQLLRNLGAREIRRCHGEGGIGDGGNGAWRARRGISTMMALPIWQCARRMACDLFHNEGNGKFADVTQKVGIVREKGCVSATFVDYDHDGDLDLYLTMEPSKSGNTPKDKRKNKMWRNNGNSTFTDVSVESGLGVDATGADVAVTDFNNDRAIDFVIAGRRRARGDLFESTRGEIHGITGY